MHRSPTSSRFLTAALLATAMVVLPAARADDAPAASPLRGGRVITYLAGSVNLEGVLDAPNSTLTLYGLAVDGTMPSADLDPVVVLADGTEIRIPKLSGQESAWQLRDERLGKGLATAGIRIHVDGKTSDMPWTPVVPGGSAQPRPAGLRSGVLAFRDGPSLRVVCDEARRTLRLEPLTPTDAQAIQEAPSVLVGSGDELRVIAVQTVGSNGSTAWTVESTEIFRPGAGAFVRLIANSKTYVASLADVTGSERGTRGGMIVLFAGGSTSVEVVHDPKAGTLVVYRLEPLTAGMPAVSAAPVVTLETAQGPQVLQLEAMTDQAGAWRITSPYLRTERTTGRVQVKIGDRTVDAPLPRAEQLDAQSAAHPGNAVPPVRPPAEVR